MKPAERRHARGGGRSGARAAASARPPIRAAIAIASPSDVVGPLRTYAWPSAPAIERGDDPGREVVGVDEPDPDVVDGPVRGACPAWASWSCSPKPDWSPGP